MPLWKPFADPVLSIRLFLSLYKTNVTMVRGLEEQLQPLGLTLGRLCLLVALDQSADPRLPSELGDDLAVTRANVSGLLNTLQRQGYVTREIDPSNRRQMLVALTSEGKQALEEASPIYREAIDGAMGRLSAHEQATLLALLEKLAGV